MDLKQEVLENANKEEIDFLNEIIRTMHLKNYTNIYFSNVFDINYKKNYDVVFLFKALPVLEQQEKGISKKILNNLKFNYAVVTFPVKSINGQEKGMKRYYEKSFLDLIKDKFSIITEIHYTNELVFIIKKLLHA